MRVLLPALVGIYVWNKARLCGFLLGHKTKKRKNRALREIRRLLTPSLFFRVHAHAHDVRFSRDTYSALACCISGSIRGLLMISMGTEREPRMGASLGPMTMMKRWFWWCEPILVTRSFLRSDWDFGHFNRQSDGLRRLSRTLSIVTSPRHQSQPTLHSQTPNV